MMGPVGIQPDMQLDASFMGGIGPEFQRIVKRGRRLSLFACQVVRPGFQFAFVEGITLRTHLQNDGVEMMYFEKIQQGDCFPLLFFGAQTGFTGPVDIGNRSYPGSPEFALGGKGGWRAYCCCLAAAVFWGGAGEPSEK